MKTIELLKQHVRDIPDFPKPGILFRDITPILEDPKAAKILLELLKNKVSNLHIEGIAGIESRGFIFGQALALELGLPFYLIRKKGKLPAQTFQADYELEYGAATIEMHKDSIPKGKRILIHDDLLATGGTASAAASLIEQSQAQVAGYLFIICISALKGEERLKKRSPNVEEIHSVIYY